MNDLINLNDAIEIIAQTDITDGTEPVFSGKQVQALLKNLDAVPAIPISVIEDIKAEIKELIDWHDCPMELDNGNDAWYCEACNMAISIIDKHIKEFTE